jgi:hypothetical protein
MPSGRNQDEDIDNCWISLELDYKTYRSSDVTLAPIANNGTSDAVNKSYAKNSTLSTHPATRKQKPSAHELFGTDDFCGTSNITSPVSSGTGE